jgi:nitroreductase
MTTSDLPPDVLLSTTRAVRKRLDLERPVPRELVEECVNVAIQAPTASNTQNWHFVLIDDPSRRLALAEIYRRAWDNYVQAMASAKGYPESDPRGQRAGAVGESAAYLAANFERVPVLLIPCLWGRVPESDAPTWRQAGFWGSLFPAVWSFMLAARARGLGTAWTSMHLQFEREAADVVGIPFDSCSQGGLIPVAYSIGTDFKPASRLPLDRVLHWNQW